MIIMKRVIGCIVLISVQVLMQEIGCQYSHGLNYLMHEVNLDEKF